jgi:hypothetical protein
MSKIRPRYRSSAKKSAAKMKSSRMEDSCLNRIGSTQGHVDSQWSEFIESYVERPKSRVEVWRRDDKAHAKFSQ